MLRVAAILSVLFIAAFARDGYICEVILPGFELTHPVVTLDSATYDLSDNFNAISFDSFSAASGDVEGRLIVKNNLVLPSSYSIGYELRTRGAAGIDSPLPYSLVVGHDAVFGSGAVYPHGDNIPYPADKEYIRVGGTFSGASYLRDDVRFGANFDAELSSAHDYYVALQNAFAAVGQNVNYDVQYQGITITCPSMNGGSWSLNIEASLFSTITYYTTVGCSNESQIVFNIGGSGSVTFAGDNQHTWRSERVLYNILGERTINIQTEIDGNILAPNAQYSQTGGVAKGQVIVGNVALALQINRVNCVRPQPPTPTDHLCPGFETDCAGLTSSLGGSPFSFRLYNVISFGDFNATTGDVEGRVAARNNVNLGAGFSIGFELQTANNNPDASLAYSLIAGGNVVWGSGSIHPDGTGIPHAGPAENALVGGTFTAPADLTARGRTGVTSEIQAALDAARECYQGYSDLAASKSDNVATEYKYTGLFITCNSDSATEYVVSITPEQFNSFTYTMLSNCNFQAGWIINVRGTGDVTIHGDSFPAIPGVTVYNVIGQRTVNVIDTALTGHLLAPNANLVQPESVIVGKVVVANVVQSKQINKQDTCPITYTVQIPVVTLLNAQRGRTFAVEGADSFRVGDETTLGSIEAINGNEVTFENELSNSVSAGAVVGYASVPSTAGRGFVANRDGSDASVAGVALAVFAVAAMLL